VTATPTHRAINAVFRIESPRLIAGLARIVRDVGLAEELAQGRTSTRRSTMTSATITACHARARAPEETDWARIAALYGQLGALAPSPVVELNRAVAVSMAEGPAAGLRLVDALMSEPSLEGYHLLPSARADLLARLGRLGEARVEFERAASLTRNARQRERLLERAATCARDGEVDVCGASRQKGS
jgi:RNA polymerase sigma-70 factor, ECF subfamily